MKKWTIFIITHRNIFEEMYFYDPLFSHDHFKFLSDSKLDDRYSSYRILYTSEMPNYTRFGKEYQETTVIYNLYKNPDYYNDLDYIGFLHYDFDLNLEWPEVSVTDKISRYIEDRSKAHISFGTFDFSTIYHQYILADINQPRKHYGVGYNCFNYILDDYNRYFGTSYPIENLSNKKYINMNSAFLVDVRTFRKMMGFCGSVIESGKLNIFGPEEIRPAELLERYYGTFLALEFDDFLRVNLGHHYQLKNQ